MEQKKEREGSYECGGREEGGGEGCFEEQEFGKWGVKWEKKKVKERKSEREREKG